jgi:hypothetical protein
VCAGRLYQVEYAIAAIQNAAAAVGLQTKGGIVIATEKRVASKLLAPSKTSEKVYKIDEHVGAPPQSRRRRAGAAARREPEPPTPTPPRPSLPPLPLRAQVFTAVAGLTSDANILVQYARLAAQRYRCEAWGWSACRAVGVHTRRVRPAAAAARRSRAPRARRSVCPPPPRRAPTAGTRTARSSPSSSS